MQEQMWLETRSEKCVGSFSHRKESVGTGLGGRVNCLVLSKRVTRSDLILWVFSQKITLAAGWGVDQRGAR